MHGIEHATKARRCYFAQLGRASIAPPLQQLCPSGTWTSKQKTGLSEIKPEPNVKGLVINSIFVLKFIIVIYEI